MGAPLVFQERMTDAAFALKPVRIMEAYLGRHLDILVEKTSPEWPGLHVGRAWFQAPEVDGVTYISGPNVTPGQIVRAEITETHTYDLSALAD